METINLTTNLKLQKPTSDEKYNVQTQNTNMDILDSSIKSLQDKDATLTKQTDFTLHTSSKNNPHNVTKEQLGLSNLINQRQIPAIQTAVTDGGIPIFDSNGYTLKDSGYTIGKSVPEDAEFTDTLYVHPESGVDVGKYTKVSVDSNGHVIYGSNPTTIHEYGITDAAPINHSHVAAEVGADPAGSADTALINAKDYTDNKLSAIGVKGESEITYRTGQVNITKGNIGLENVENKSSSTIRNEITKANVVSALGYTPETNGAYENATAYTDVKIADLINGAPSTLDTLKEIADAMDENQTVVESLEAAVGTKANDIDFQAHKNNTTVHLTSAEHTEFTDANCKKHTHSNKSIIESITQELIDAWNSAVAHISDTIKHITATERTNWNAAKTHADSAHAPSNAQKNSEITKAEIEAKLTGIVNTHSHPAQMQVVADLLSTVTGSALDATMGKVLNDKIVTFQQSFRDGCDAIMAAVTAKGATPASNSVSDIVAAINSLTDTHDATMNAAAQLLTGYTAYSKGVKYTGTMVNRGAVTSSINAGGSYIIPVGYHNGSGKVTGNTLASQTSATAVAANLTNGKTAWVNGARITGTGADNTSNYNSGYSAGVVAADGRANPGSTNYITGYNAGVTAGKNSIATAWFSQVDTNLYVTKHDEQVSGANNFAQRYIEVDVKKITSKYASLTANHFLFVTTKFHYWQWDNAGSNPPDPKPINTVLSYVPSTGILTIKHIWSSSNQSPNGGGQFGAAEWKVYILA